MSSQTTAQRNQASPSGVPTDNQAPLVCDEWLTVKAGQSVSAHQSVLLLNDRDVDGGVLSIAELGKPTHGTLTRAADGTLTYVADPSYSGQDSFTYKVSDGQGGFTTGTVHITVEACNPPVNKPPVTQDEWVTVQAGVAVNAHESALLTNDADPEGGPLSIRNIGKPAHGSLTRAPDGTLTYVADPGYSGTDSFTYEVVDAQGLATTATVHINVLPAALAVQITAVVDDVGAQTGPVAVGGVTDDRRPTIQGRTEANATVTLYDGSTKLGEVKADANGNFVFTPSVDLAHGPHDFKAIASTPDGRTAHSNPWNIAIDCPTVPPLPAPVVVIGEDLNNDGVINKTENTGRADAIVTLSAGTKAGDTLIVTDQSGAKQEKLLTAADIAAGKVTFTDGFAMPAEGQTLTLTAQIRSSEGVLSDKSTDSALIDTTGPGDPVITIVTDTDNNGRINKGELAASGGMDLKVDLPATAKAGDKLTVVDQDGRTLNVTLTEAHIAAKAVSFDNAFPTPAPGQTFKVTATLTDPAGNVSQPSTDSALLENPPSEVLTVSSPQVTEGQALVFNVNTSSSNVDTLMTLNLASGTATVGTDTANNLQVNFGNGWINLVGNQVLVPAGTTSYQVQVVTIDDRLVERNESVTLTVSAGTLNSKQGTGTILDNDNCNGFVSGTEDTPLVLSWSNFNADLLQGAQAKLQISSLPADGLLQFNNNGTWTAVSVNQVFNKADIDAGKLRFLPDAQESGTDAYGGAGTGNKQSDYTKFGFTLFGQDGQAHTGSTLTVDITPIADPGTWQACTPKATGTTGLHTWSFLGLTNGAGRYTSPDIDGSERTMIALKWQQGMKITDGTTGATWFPPHNPTALVWIKPNDSVTVWTSPIAGNACGYRSKLEYAIYRQEVNSQGTVLHELSTGFKVAQKDYISPLMLDLNQDGVQTVGLEHGVAFDLNGDGQKEHTGWADGKDGFLVLDRNQDGQINDGSELFGNGTVTAQGQQAEDGFAALADLDSNGDGQITAADAQFANLQVWVDSNLDGQTQAGELVHLGEVGVVSLSLQAQQTEVLQNGNIIGLVSTFTKADGSTHELADVWFGLETQDLTAAALDAKDLLACGAMHEVCSGDPKSPSLADNPATEAQLVAHSALQARVAFERWDEPAHAML